MTMVENGMPRADIVRLRNEGDTPFSQKYAGQRYTIQPGQEWLVPFMAMCLWLGHPDAVDIDKKRRFRTQEFQRLCVKYGIYEHHELVPERFPKVTAWDVISNEELITVVKDPDGKHLTPDVQTKMERDNLAAQMRQMQDQINILQQQLQQQDRAIASGTAAGDMVADNPTHRPEVQVSPPLDDTLEPPVDETGGAEIDRPQTPRPVARTN